MRPARLRDCHIGWPSPRWGTAVAVGVVCAVGLFSLGNTSQVAHLAVKRQLALADEASAMSAFLYQKGFVAEYLLTGDRSWLQELETSRPAFESWLAQAREQVGSSGGNHALDDIRGEYVAFDTARRQAIALYDEGHIDEAKAQLDANRSHARRLRELFQRLGHEARTDAEGKMAEAEGSVRRLSRLLVATSVAGALASLIVGFLWARKITKPIYELEVKIESAAERTRIKVEPGRQGLEALGDQVTAMVEKLEQTDADLAEHRRRLIQSEKLSAVGELAAKLAHEVLNPLAGIKAAVQLLARHDSGPVESSPAMKVAEAVSREVTRVDGLLRRVMNFARPLAPRVQVVTLGSLLDAAVEATGPVLAKRNATVERREEPGLPPLEADPLLLTQAFANLLANAADSMGPDGGPITVEAGRTVSLGRDQIVVRVKDHGSGIASDVIPELFKPFFTTKSEGHGLGLAVTQNIVLEHGGRIAGSNRPPSEGPGAVFEVMLPILR